MERTLAIIKPDAFASGAAGPIIEAYNQAGFKIVAMKLARMTKSEAAGFYHVHEDKPFFGELVDFMIGGPCILLVLEGDGIIEKNRELMGATDPAKAAEGTIRARFGTNIQNNAVHGSDGPDTARFEIWYFFNAFEFMA